MSLWSNLTTRIFSDEISKQVKHALLAAETDSTFTVGARSFNQNERDRFDYDREVIQKQALQAWRVNPLARRIVGLTSQYVVGGGITPTSKNPKTAEFINLFWEHRLNKMAVRCFEWCDELTRTGNLFIRISTDAAGMTYVRAYPASTIQEIKTKDNDPEQPIEFVLRAAANSKSLDPERIPAYDFLNDSPDNSGKFPSVMLHYAINRPVGAEWGESDLAPLLRWLSRYANWLEDRARLNRYRNSFLFVVKSKFQSEAERLSRQAQLNANPPTPGSILVTDDSEEWSILSAKLDSVEASTDGLALKKMIAAGAGAPMHFLAEPESATRTTAEASGGPTYRHYEQRQNFFLWLLSDLLSVAIKRRSMVDQSLTDPEFTIKGADISARDNVSFGMATMYVVNAFKELRDRQLIDDSELLHMVYRFAGENADVEELLKRGAAAPPPIIPNDKSTIGDNLPNPAKKLIDPETGELKTVTD